MLAGVAAGLSLYVYDKQPELDAVMTEQLEIAAEQRFALLSVGSEAATREAALRAYGDGSASEEDGGGGRDPRGGGGSGGGASGGAEVDWSAVPRDSIPAEELGAARKGKEAAADGGTNRVIEYP